MTITCVLPQRTFDTPNLRQKKCPAPNKTSVLIDILCALGSHLLHCNALHWVIPGWSCAAEGKDRLPHRHRPYPRQAYDDLPTRYLKKTLEAQRAANRERLIRKVYNDPPGLNIHRPLIPEEQIDQLHNALEAPAEATPSKTSLSRRSSTKEPTQERLIGPSVRIPWVVKGDGSTNRPWLDFLRTGGELRDASSVLGSEISALAEFLRPSTTERLVVKGILDDISKQLLGAVPSPPQLVGSWSTQTASSTSTIDLMILVPGVDAPHHKSTPMNPRTIKMFTGIIERAELEMKNSTDFDGCHVIYEKSPALVMPHKASGLSIRLFCGSYLPKSDGFMRDSLANFPSLQPLYMVLRVLLESRNIFGWEAASVDSYGLFLLITAFLKQQKSPTEYAQKSLGEQLLSILNTYGSAIDLSTTGISVDPAGFFSISNIRESGNFRIEHGDNNNKNNGSNGKIYPAYLVGQRALMRYKINAGNKGNQPAAKHLCIQDPTNHLNDAGLRCLRTAELQKTLSQLHRDLQSALQRWDDGDRGIDSYSILGQILSHASFDNLLRRRKMLSE
ncbi:hypothetical protein UA08_02072 [Talaromyces atroroseus]|uniref:Polynucleotide adenylyltransferase n=1 Tax=Talaromyces atroroseus TaxID=1441469 RepID=A0A1Q5QBZ2_TALAT|nr:hypothetical protein UA08_02072 [Talaromyces atroroseus]OKL63455.1 hypothetical protein UA08_02072 [Talaromyces atroroseus]